MVKKPRPDRTDYDMMRTLLEEMDKNDSPKHFSILLSMQIAYEAYVVKKKSVEEMLGMIENAKKQYPESLDIRRVASDYYYFKRITSKLEDIEEDVE